MHQHCGPVSMYSLPQELTEKIVHQLKGDRRSLLFLSLVSVSFQVAAQAHIFRRIAFVPESKKGDSRYKYFRDESEEELFPWVLPLNRVHAFLSILEIRSSHFIGALVRNLSLAFSELESYPNNLTDDLHHALQQMISLKCLQVSLGPLTNVCMAIVLADLPCQLTKFCLLDRRQYPEENDAYITFLSSQHHLKYFHFVSSLLVPCSRSFHCPTLETFVGDPTQSSTIFPSLTQITSLGLVDSPWSNALPVSSLIPMTSILSQLRMLTLYSCFFKEPALEKLFGYMSSLEILEVALDERTTTNRLTKHATLMLNYIHKLTYLRQFIWHVFSDKYHQRQLSVLTRDTQEAWTKYWFSSSPYFQEACFAIGPDVDTYWRWTRGRSEPDEVSSVSFRGRTPFRDIVFDLHLAG